MLQNINTINNYFNCCTKALESGNNELAYSYLQKAYMLMSSIPKRHIIWSNYYINLAAIYNNKGDFFKCIECCNNAEKFVPYTRSDNIIAKLESCKASAFKNLGDYKNSLECEENAIRLYKRANENVNVAKELLTCGHIFLRTGTWDQAIKYFSEALFISKREKNKKLEAESLMKLGFVFRGHRFLYLAVDHYREAERIFNEINYTPGLEVALYERANTYLSLKMPEETLSLISEIEKFLTPDSMMHSFLLKLHFCVHNQKKNFQGAMDCANNLLEFFKRANDKRGEAESLEMIAGVYYNLSNLDLAQQYGKKALQIANEIGDSILEHTCIGLIQDTDNLIKNGIDLDKLRNDEFYDIGRG